jgi:electron transfer flavoprotein beta subunit
MNLIVCAKQVVDVAEIKMDAASKKPILVGVPQKISDMDKNALEEAIKIKEKHGGKSRWSPSEPLTRKNG